MTTASQQVNIPTWKEVIGNALLVEYELKFDVNFSQRKHIYFTYDILCVFALLDGTKVTSSESLNIFFMTSLLALSLSIPLKFDDACLFPRHIFLSRS